MAWDGMGLAGWQVGPVSVSCALCDCVTRGAPQCWSRRACQSGMLWLASCQTGQTANLVMVVTTVRYIDGQPSRASVLLI